MSSSTAEIVHDQHTHPTKAFYVKIGAALIFLTILEILGYVGETRNMYGPGMAATIILFLSALKFLFVVGYYMHLKFDHKLFTGIFVFPALLGTLVIVACLMLFGPVHGTSTDIHGTSTQNEAIHGAGTAAPHE
jgi:cytochrome c oxidase subunit 4